MSAQKINRISGIVLVLFSLSALLLVVNGYTHAPPPIPPGRSTPDEGTEANLFQLLIVALVPTTLLFLATADWTQPWRSARPLAIAAAALVFAFTALYYLENYFYPAHFR